MYIYAYDIRLSINPILSTFGNRLCDKKTGGADLQYMLTGKENTSCDEIIVRDTE